MKEGADDFATLAEKVMGKTQKGDVS